MALAGREGAESPLFPKYAGIKKKAR